jgi:cytochrome o ubiquinol oxidase subunit 2
MLSKYTSTRESAVRDRLARCLLLRAAALSVLYLLGGCHSRVLEPAGPISAGERIILLDSLVIMLAIAVPTILATLAFAFWFRASNTRARYLPDFAYSGRLELIVWSIPALVIFFLGGIAWISAHLLDPAEPIKSRAQPLEVDVVSLDWKWLFIYPQQNIATINQMTVPAGVPLNLKITSASVFNVFFVPQLGSEIYSMYGMTSRLNLQADEPGVYLGMSAHFSGDGFPGMTFDVHAVPVQEFAAWVAGAHREGPALDEQAYRGLLRQSMDVKPYTYKAVREHLFEDIVNQKLPPGEGPPSADATPGTAAVLVRR